MTATTDSRPAAVAAATEASPDSSATAPGVALDASLRALESEAIQIIREVAADRGAVLLDVAAAVTGGDGRWLPGLSDDGIHPLPAGAALMAAAAARALRSTA